MPIKIQRKMRVLVIAAAMTFVSASFYGRRVGVFASTEYEAAETANTAACAARAECVAELSSRRILYEKNGEDRLPMASTTKIATALTVLEGGNDLDETFKVPAAGCGIEGSSAYLKEGEETSERDLLYGLMLRSGNDCAVTLALREEGSVRKFAEKMNRTAQRAGALHTHFKNPHGLPEKGHYTTARDLTFIACLALENPVFAEIVSTKYYEKKNWTNKNKMLENYDGAIGVKTGFTKQAGRCLVSAARRGNMTLVCTVLSCGDTYGRSSALLDDAFSAYENVLLQAADSPVALRSARGNITAKTGKDLRYPLLAEEKKYVKKVAIAFDTPAFDGNGREISGQLRIYLLNNLLFSENLYKL